MKYQILFSGKNKENITNLSSAELAQRMVKVKTCHEKTRVVISLQSLLKEKYLQYNLNGSNPDG